MRLVSLAILLVTSAAAADVRNPAISKDKKTLALPEATSIDGCVARVVTFAPVGKTDGQELPVANSCDGSLDLEDVQVVEKKLAHGKYETITFHRATGGSLAAGAVTIAVTAAAGRATVEVRVAGKAAAKKALELDTSIGQSVALDGVFFVPGAAYLLLTWSDTAGGAARTEWMVVAFKGGPKKLELGPAVGAGVAWMRELTDRVCACKDRNCAQGPLNELRAGTARLQNLSQDDQRLITQEKQRLITCYRALR
jgi:hypothetical protein